MMVMMIQSEGLKALEVLYNRARIEAGPPQNKYITYAMEMEHNEYVKKHYDIIKQDLDRLEQLEKENQELKCKYEIYDFLYQNEVSKNGALAGKIFEKDLKNQKIKKALDIIKKHFIIKLEEETDLNGNVWGRLVSIQSKEDEGTWDTTACANIVNCKEDFDLLEEVLEE